MEPLPIDPDSRLLLTEARKRAQKLLDDLLAQREEIEKNPPPLDPQKMQAGREAFENAINAARRTVENIDKTLASGQWPVN